MPFATLTHRCPVLLLHVHSLTTNIVVGFMETAGGAVKIYTGQTVTQIWEHISLCSNIKCFIFNPFQCIYQIVLKYSEFYSFFCVLPIYNETWEYQRYCLFQWHICTSFYTLNSYHCLILIVSKWLRVCFNLPVGYKVTCGEQSQ